MSKSPTVSKAAQSGLMLKDDIFQDQLFDLLFLSYLSYNYTEIMEIRNYKITKWLFFLEKSCQIKDIELEIKIKTNIWEQLKLFVFDNFSFFSVNTVGTTKEFNFFNELIYLPSK